MTKNNTTSNRHLNDHGSLELLQDREVIDSVINIRINSNVKHDLQQVLKLNKYKLSNGIRELLTQYVRANRYRLINDEQDVNNSL